MMNLKWLIAFTFLMGLATPAWAHDSGILLGTLHEGQTSSPIVKATVFIQAEDYSYDFKTGTDDRGRFAYAGLPAGRYLVTITKEDYAPIDVFDVIINRGESTRLILEMTRAEAAPFKRQLVRYRPPLLNREDATIKTVYRSGPY